jgi:hypothetical protein
MELSGRLYNQQIEREALLILFNGLNDKINEMMPTWEDEDDNLWISLNKGSQDWSIEEIDEDNFYAGIIPSLINAPKDNYPNVSVICYQGQPTDSSDDTGELYKYTLNVEIMVKSGSFTEDYDVNLQQQVNTRIQKTVEAAHLTILDDRTLNNTVSQIGAPSFSVGDVFVRREDGGRAPKWYWQGGILIYDIYKFVNLVN